MDSPATSPLGPEARRFNDPDIDLMLLCKAGDRAAFETLVLKHTRSVLGLIHRYLPDPSRAEDAAQDVFVKVYRSREGYEPQAKFSTWLFRITVNHCLNEIRSRKSQGTVAATGEEEVAAPIPESPDDRMKRAELQAAVREAIDSLPDHQRMAILLSRFHELSYEEIGAAMDLSLEAVKSLLFRAKDNLKDRLKRHLN